MRREGAWGTTQLMKEGCWRSSAECEKKKYKHRGPHGSEVNKMVLFIYFFFPIFVCQASKLLIIVVFVCARTKEPPRHDYSRKKAPERQLLPPHPVVLLSPEYLTTMQAWGQTHQSKF